MAGAELAIADPTVTPHATAPGDIYELVISLQETQNNTFTLQVFHFRALTSGLTATSLIADWRANIETTHRVCVCTGVNIVRYVAFNLIPFQTDWAEQRVSLPGTGASTLAPPLVAWVTTWRTALPGRRYRGRTYWGGMSSTGFLGGRLNSNGLTGAFFNLPNAILTRYGATGVSTDTRIGVWSRVNGGQSPPHSPAGFTQITSFTVQLNIASMGTRRIGRGM